MFFRDGGVSVECRHLVVFLCLFGSEWRDDHTEGS